MIEQSARSLLIVVALKCGYTLVLRRVGEVVSSVERRSRCRVTRVELEDLCEGVTRCVLVEVRLDIVKELVICAVRKSQGLHDSAVKKKFDVRDVKGGE